MSSNSCKTVLSELRQKYNCSDADLRTPDHDAVMLWLNEHLNEVIADYIANTMTDVVSHTLNAPEWEKVLKTERGYRIGFIDLYVVVGITGRREAYDKSMYEYREQQIFYFEVKPYVHSIGEVMRQIKGYMDAYQGNYFLVSPDDRFAHVFESQGIHFVRVTQ